MQTLSAHYMTDRDIWWKVLLNTLTSLQVPKSWGISQAKRLSASQL